MKNLLTLTIFAIISLLATSSRAQQGPAGKYLEKQHERVVKALKQDAETDRQQEKQRKQVAKTLTSLLDYESVAKQSLDTHWANRAERERQEFVTLLRQLVERNYQRNLKSTLNYEIKFRKEEPLGDDRVRVVTKARSKKNRRAPGVEIGYVMQKQGAGWGVVDVVTDGVSMVDNYRSQFGRIIAKDGWDGLIEKMRKRLDSDDVL